MYEKFTDRARRVFQLANQEAQRFNHEYVGTEHVLMGLIKEGSGVASNALQNLGYDVRKIRLEVEKLVQSGPDMVTMGKLPQTPRAKKVIEFAMDEARLLNHNHVGTEHILLGLLREGEGTASQVLLNLGLRLKDVRNEVLLLLGCKNAPVERLRMTFQILHVAKGDYFTSGMLFVNGRVAAHVTMAPEEMVRFQDILAAAAKDESLAVNIGVHEV